MKERCFDSAGADRARVHRSPFVTDCGAIHAIGNGEQMIYGRGPEWMQVLGAPYSCPNLFSLVIPEGESVRCVSRRREKAGSWEHVLPQGTLTDLASRSARCLARSWDLSSPFRLEADFLDREYQNVTGLCPGCSAAFLITVPACTPMYNDYPILHRIFALLVWDGDCAFDGTTTVLSSRGVLRVCGGRDYGDCFRTMSAARSIPFEKMLSDADAEDARFLADCAVRRAPLRAHPLKNRAVEAIEDALLMIRAQQDNSGGIQAGHNYHLGYVRDQYGDFRGLLAGGAVDCARKVLAFYRRVFEKCGVIHNAQAMGVDGIFHVHETDASEITGYLLLQATDYLRATKDTAFFATLIPLLDWAFREQQNLLYRDMLPFNGDETYIAGGILPRSVLNHGSFEATLLFITGGERYLEARRALLPVSPEWENAQKTVDRVRNSFDRNFKRPDGYAANAAARMEGLTEPEFRHGVCLNCHTLSWQHRVSRGVYLCAKCSCKPFTAPEPAEYRLKSTLLMAPFLSSPLLPKDFLKAQTERFVRDFEKTGMLPSLPEGNLCLGYDFGLLLFAAAETGVEADTLLEKMLLLQDECGAWSEYYKDMQPTGTRCRPWESAINIAGAIAYLREAN